MNTHSLILRDPHGNLVNNNEYINRYNYFINEDKFKLFDIKAIGDAIKVISKCSINHIKDYIEDNKEELSNLYNNFIIEN